MILSSVQACEGNNFNGQFSFINKHARNFNRREKSEVTSVASHAAGHYYQKVKKSQIAQEGNHVTASPDIASTPCQTVQTRQLPKHSSTPNILLWNCGVATPVESKKDKLSKKAPRKSRSLSPRNSSSSPTSIPSPPKAVCLGKPDPFDTFPCRLGPRSAELTHIWYCYFMNLCSPAGGSRKVTAIAERAWQRRVRGVMQDQMQACAFFAGALAIRARFLAPETAKETWPEVYRLHNDALGSLRQCLESQTYSEAVLLTMFTVGSINFYTGDWSDNRQHQRAATRITHMLGGPDNLSESTQDYMIEGAISTSFCLMSRPKLHFQQWDTGSWSSQSLAEDWPCPLGEVDFSEDLSRPSDDNEEEVGFMSERLVEHFGAYREVLGVCKIAQSLGSTNVDDKDQIFIWLRRRRRAMRVRCLDYWSDLQDSLSRVDCADYFTRAEVDDQILQIRLHQALILAADCFDAMFFHHQRCHANALPMWLIYLPIPQLRQALHTLLETMTGQGSLSHPEALMWLFFVGTCAEEIARRMGVRLWPDKLDLNCREWFVDVWERLGLEDVGEVKEVLGGFLYDERFGDKYLAALLQE
jgi:hypothetical protein